ncbi:PREDICTED: transcriptional adapter 1-like [Priapulus caudatus]|uniref:Transcriptional adapter 1-like n=1 Tax=Priapulus caudatus TaxID=37621 RepID=A0ABM1EFZ4_PRICU|nr:PREDICTED: transcriptional adapter 1-like [Priapulus caudatus]
MASSTELGIAKNKLTEFLGDNSKIYFSIMKQWFKEKISKEEFDMEARKLFTPNKEHLHNEFLLAILNRCQIPGLQPISQESSATSAPKKPLHKVMTKKEKAKKRSKAARASFEHRFAAEPPLRYTPQVVQKEVHREESLGFCSRDLTLPDVSMLHGRMFVIAWEMGLEEVEEGAIKSVQLATEAMLKNILSALLSRRNAYKIRDGGFKFALGCDVPNPYLRNTRHVYDYDTDSNVTFSNQGVQMASARPTREMGEEEAIYQVACGGGLAPAKPPITTYDLLETLQACVCVCACVHVWVCATPRNPASPSEPRDALGTRVSLSESLVEMSVAVMSRLG